MTRLADRGIRRLMKGPMLALVVLLGGLAVITGTTVVAGQALPPAQATAAARSAAAIPREEVVEKARAHAKLNVLDLEVIEARTDDVDAEMITLAEADRRLGGQRGAAGYGTGLSADSPVWWVTASGQSQGRGPQDAQGRGAGLQRSPERIFVYDANTGRLIGMRIAAE